MQNLSLSPEVQMNQFGGNWTDDKIEILVEYAQSYLQIMKKYTYWNLLYFDGFAGSGFIDRGNGKFNNKVTIGAARRIVSINEPISFDEFYFVEKKKKNVQLLEENTKNAYPDKIIYITQDDCNRKLIDMANWLRSEKGKSWKVLAYLDPCGMQLEWASITALKGLPVDAWILVPTGMGVSRLITNNGDIEKSWITRLQKFLGLPADDIKKYFYVEDIESTLFGDELRTKKIDNVITKSGDLYRVRLGEVFDYVSNPFILKNTIGSTMYHFFMASNNKTAVKIANYIIGKYNRKYNNG